MSIAVITDNCTKDLLCVDVCSVEAIHPTADEPKLAEVPQLYIDPAACVSCGSCIATCEREAIFMEDELSDENKKFIEINANYFKS
jgi:ferredoxin--NADP+ reductase